MSNCLPRIAVLDDDAGFRNSIARLLRSSGFEAVVFETGDSLLEGHADEPCDCVLTDLCMGGLFGFEVQWRLSTLYPGLPVILLSESADDASTRAVAIDNGFVACLPKPCEGQELLSAIGQALGDARQSIESLTWDI